MIWQNQLTCFQCIRVSVSRPIATAIWLIQLIRQCKEWRLIIWKVLFRISSLFVIFEARLGDWTACNSESFEKIKVLLFLRYPFFLSESYPQFQYGYDSENVDGKNFQAFTNIQTNNRYPICLQEGPKKHHLSKISIANFSFFQNVFQSLYILYFF